MQSRIAVSIALEAGVKWKIFRDINFVNVNYQPFSAADWSLADCGRLGPVTLTAATAVAN